MPCQGPGLAPCRWLTFRGQDWHAGLRQAGRLAAESRLPGDAGLAWRSVRLALNQDLDQDLEQGQEEGQERG